MTHTITEIKIESWLPLFSGFYHTIWSPDNEERNEAHYIADEYGYDEADVFECLCDVMDYKAYERDVVEQIAEQVEFELHSEGYIKELIFEEIKSPRQYNFKNDSANVTFVLTDENVEKIKQTLLEYEDEFAQFLKGRYTSGPGFISYHSNCVEEWKEELDHYNTLDVDAHKLGSILDFILQNVMEVSEDSLYYVIEVYVGEYYDRDALLQKIHQMTGEGWVKPSERRCKHCNNPLNEAHMYDHDTLQLAKKFKVRTGKESEVVCYKCAEAEYGKDVSGFTEKMEEAGLSVYADEDMTFDPFITHPAFKNSTL